MGMVVQHNLTAMNSNRMLGQTVGLQAKSTEKLSSGYKINRAADDASGLAISEKMRKQIRGLTQASANAQDGISAVQTAEGALGEVQDMLQRMNELAIKAANGTNSESDRSAIQNEVNQLKTEIDRVAETTKFNETYLLKGDNTKTNVESYSYGLYAKDVAASIMGYDEAGDDKAGEMTDAATGAVVAVAFGAVKNARVMEDQNTLAKSIINQGITYDYSSEKINGVVATVKSISLNGDAAEQFKVVSEDGDEFSILNSSNEVVATITMTWDDVETNIGKAGAEGDSYKTTGTLAAKSGTAATSKKAQAAYYDKDGNKVSANALGNYFGMNDDGDAVLRQLNGTRLYDALGKGLNAKYFEDNQETEVKFTKDLTASLDVSLHVGADATKNNQITLNIDALSSKGLGINGLAIDGTDDTNALAAVETIKEAIAKVSAQRAELGAVQNRLEHTIKNLDNVVENTTAAESQIRDTDMASEMVQYSKNQILTQAGQSMLAQANQSNQGVLSLLG